MFKRRLMFKRVLPALCFAAGIITNVHAETIAAGTVVTVRTDTDIDTRDTASGRVYSGVVNKDVYDGGNRIAIPKGSDVELMVRDTGKRSLALDLDAIVIKGRRY